MVALYASNGEIVPKMLQLKSYGKIFLIIKIMYNTML